MKPQYRVKTYTTTAQFEIGSNLAAQEGYSLHSWEERGVNDAIFILAVYQKIPNPQDT